MYDNVLYHTLGTEQKRSVLFASLYVDTQEATVSSVKELPSAFNSLWQGHVTVDLHNVRVVEPLLSVTAFKDCVKSSGTPSLEGVEDMFGVNGFGVERAIEKAFQVPAQLVHQVRVGTAFHGLFIRGGNFDRCEGFAAPQASQFESGRGGVFDLLNGQRGNWSAAGFHSRYCSGGCYLRSRLCLGIGAGNEGIKSIEWKTALAKQAGFSIRDAV